MFMVTTAAAVGSAVVAGLLFAFSTAVMPALRQRPPAEGMQTMQAVNRVILNPVFLGTFMGTAVACGVLVVWSALAPGPGAPWRIAGAVTYLIGVFGITAALNVPLNNRLESLDAGAPDAQRFWAEYLVRWTRWNHVRTCAGIVAAGLLIVSTAPN
ncbi:MAG: anthrone oxygenase family protein [Vicinamibacterales bacterium]